MLFPCIYARDASCLTGPQRTAALGELSAAKESDVIAAARADPDAPPTSRRDLRKFERVTLAPVEVKAIRRKSGVSQAAFAKRYGLNLRTLQDWEQGRVQPDGPARAYLLVILREPRAVGPALAG